jgi:hypothetical protein
MRELTLRAGLAIIGILAITLPAMASGLRFTVDRVLLDGVVGIVDIQPVAGEVTLVEVHTPKDYKDLLQISAVGPTLKITGLKSHASYSSQVTVGSVTNVVAGSGSIGVVRIGNSGNITSDPPLRLSISLAAGRDVEFKGLTGDVTIGAIAGAVRGEASGVYHINAQALTGISLQLDGSGTLDVANVQGPVQLRVAGSSQANIRGGKIGDLSVIASGASGVQIDALADTAKVEASGASEVSLLGSRTPPQLKSSGAATISVSKP